MNSTHRYSADIAGQVLTITQGSITLDAGRAPHVEASIVVPIAYLDLLDPRESPRVSIKVDASFSDHMRGDVPPIKQTRTFDLGVRARPARHGDATITVDLASDEALLEDYRPLSDVTNVLDATTIRQVVQRVLARVAPGATLEPSPNLPATTAGASDDALLWKAGVSALDFLQPLVQAAGLRLVCDERRIWTLRNENYTGYGEIITATTGEDLIEAEDTIDRDTDLWFDARITRYRWTDAAGVQQERVDSYALNNPYSRATLVTVDAPYPGPGRSEYAVRRAQQRGREISATKVSDWTAHAEQPLIAVFPDGPIQFGAIQTLTYSLDTDEMRITARTIDTPATAWVLLDKGEKWNDSLPGESWIEEVA